MRQCIAYMLSTHAICYCPSVCHMGGSDKNGRS